MELLTHLFGKEDNLTSLQMAARAVLVFLTTLIIIRIGSVRTFGKETIVDNVVVITLGGILSRVITGASPFLPVMAAGFAIIVTHRLLAWLCLYNHTLGNLLKGKRKILYESGSMNRQNMRQTLISKEDLLQGSRQAFQTEDLQQLEKIFIERNGELSVVKKEEAS
jgi:uncharacterized membrane protein YcaP (DUF421 family)